MASSLPSILFTYLSLIHALLFGSALAFSPFQRPLFPETARIHDEFGSSPPASSAKRQASRTRLRMAFDGAVDPVSDLTGALARMDQVWNVQQRNAPRSRWTKLFINDNEENEDGIDDNAQTPQQGSEDFVYLLEPPSFSNPSCVIIFVGGAGLGSFPQVAYQEFLLRLSDRMNAAIITAPYGLGMDHFSLAKDVGEKCRRALIQCEEDPERLYSSNLPVYCVAHSLGCKLATIYAAATGQAYDGMGFVSFNNFSFSSTITMAKDMAQSIMEQQGRGFPGGGRPGALDDLFNVAESFLGNMGIEFSPSPEDTERLISIKFTEDRISKTRLFVMDEDDLDDSPSFLNGCSEGSPQLSALTGNHLTPVYFQMDLDDLPEEARSVADEALGGLQSASFGNNENLQELVDEVCGFLLGREPSRRPTQPLLTSAATLTDESD